MLKFNFVESVIMRTPSKAGANKLDNPTQAKTNPQSRTKSHHNKAEERVVGQPQCERMKELSSSSQGS